MTYEQFKNLFQDSNEMTKTKLKAVVHLMAGLPVLGRLVRICVAVIRLPELRAACLELNHRQHIFETEQLPALLGMHANEETLLRSVTEILPKHTQTLDEIRSRTQSVSSSVDQLLHETRKHLETLSGSMEHMADRVEYIRRELLFEMQYGASGTPSSADKIKTKTEIANPEKLAAAHREGLRLNLGCGHIPLKGYLNVDRRALPGVDIIAEVDELPFNTGALDEIYSAHLLEHFPQEQLRRELLPYWVSLLKHGGIFRSVVPDAESMIKAYVSGSYPYTSLREVTFGAQDYDGDFHFNMFIAKQIEDLLQEAGLSNVEWTATGRKNGACFEMEFKAVKK